MRYLISGGSKSFGANQVFEDIRFEIKDKEKVAIVGRNGCGKTTLLKIIAGIENLDHGDISKSKDISIGYLAQTTFSDEEKTVKEDLSSLFTKFKDMENELQRLSEQMASDHSEKLMTSYANLQEEFEMSGGYTYESEFHTLVTKFGFSLEDLERPLSSFSGGQKTRLAFVKMLMSKPDLLLLDEPTNHLDLETIEWLESYLVYYEKAVIIVSHDRMFMDSVASIIYELEYGAMDKYVGNYSHFIEEKKNNVEKQQRAFARQQKEIARLEELIEKYRYKKNKAAFAQSKIKYLDRMDKIDDPRNDTKTFKATFEPKIRGGNDVLDVVDLEIGYDHVLSKVNFSLKRQDRLGVLGPNGVGKSTLLKTLVNQVDKLGGEYLYGHQIEIGYFDQELAQFSSDKTVIDEVWDEYPDLTQTEVRTALGRFLFTGEDVFKDLRVLSGGEKVRLSFVKLLLKKANFLVLDEPTNHLDLLGKEALEEALNLYEGTILFVSHDRYFISQVATSILELKEGVSQYHALTYREFATREKEIAAASVKTVTSSKQEREDRNQLQRKIEKLEKEITKLHEDVEEIKKLQFDEDIYNDYEKMDELNNKLHKIETTIIEKEREWEESLLEFEEKYA